MTNTPSYSFARERIEKEFSSLYTQKVAPWLFMAASQGMKVVAFDGAMVSYCGVGFEGSPREVFWSSFIQPFLHDVVSRSFAESRAFCDQYPAIERRTAFLETRMLLSCGIDRVFGQMADVDRRLRGKGRPHDVPVYVPDREKRQVLRFLEERFSAELKLIPKEMVGMNRWYHEHQGLVWVIGTLVAVVGIVVAM